MPKKNPSPFARPLLVGVLLLAALVFFSLTKSVFSQAEPAATPPITPRSGQSAVWLPLIENAPSSTPTPIPTSTPSPSLTATPSATARATSAQSPPPTATTPGTGQTPEPPTDAIEWTQFGHDAQRTAYQPQAISLPWRWKWVWNGSDATGGIVSGKSGLPRNSQPVTGGGRVYIAAGVRGVFALDARNGSVLWSKTPGGAINSTPAYDPLTRALFVVSSNGTLYKLDASTGATLDEIAGGGASDLPLPPAIDGGRVFFVMGTQVHSINTATLAVNWSYDAGSPVDTPPAYSQAISTVVVVSRDLQVHAVDAANGASRWRVKPTGRTPAADTLIGDNEAVARLGWPVIAEGHGIVFIRYRLDWHTLWGWSPWPTTNEAMRANLTQRPDQQPLFALRLDTGATNFVSNVGNGGYGDGDNMPMGPPPTIRRFADGSEVAYVAMRGACLPTTQGCDGRGDARLGEMMLDGSTVPGYEAGYVRYMVNTFFPTDEMPFLSAAGNQLFAGHWEAGIAHEIVDRSNARGSAVSPITTSNLPHIVSSQDQDSLCSGSFSPSHYCAERLYNTRQWPGGFYIYWKQGQVYDEYWTGYATWVVSDGMVLFVATDGSVTALEHGTPAVAVADAAASAPEVAAEPSAAADPGELPVVAAADAAAYAGRTVTVDGVLADVFNNGKAVYLGFHKPHAGHFVVRILRADWQNFAAAPETLYAPGDHVQVTGELTWYQGDPVIYVTLPEQIR